MKKGDLVGGFIVTAVDDLPQIGVGITLIHQRTGFEVYHLLNDDAENFFGFIVSTPPEGDEGIPHILEHCLLSGSQKFPMKDAFFSVEKRSLATFLNAMTFPDMTAFPASSLVKEDYFRLLEFYGDSIFFPLLTENTFKTEGIRLEVSKNGEIGFNGIVYNEMKGVYSQFDSTAEQVAYTALFPDTCYRFEYGGDPNAIPFLTYQRFLDYYQRHYVPQNMKLFLCGSIPTEEQLKFFEERILSRVQVSGEFYKSSLQNQWKEPRRFSYDAPEGEEGATVIHSWLWNEALTPEDCMEAKILSACLCAHQGTPLYRELSESGFGSDLAPFMGGNSELRQLFFTCGIRGVKKNKIKKASQFILSVVEKLGEEGIPTDVIEGILDSLEFSMREMKDKGPTGLRYFERVLFTWMRGCSPSRWFDYAGLFETLRKRFNDPNAVKELLRQRLIENPHRADITVTSSPQYHQRWQVSAKNGAQKLLQERFTTPESLKQEMEAFKAYQNEPENELPMERFSTLSRDAVKAPFPSISYQLGKIQEATLVESEGNTNGIVYLDLFFNLDRMSQKYLFAINTFSRLLLSSGQENTPYDEVARDLVKTFGGISSSVAINKDALTLEPHLNLVIRTRFLESKLEKAMSAISNILTKTTFNDKKRIRTVLTEFLNDLFADFSQNGNAFAGSYARSYFSTATMLSEHLDGFIQYRWLKDVLKKRRSFNALIEQWKEIRRTLLTQKNILYGVCCQSESLEKIKKGLNEIHVKLPANFIEDEKRVYDLTLPPLPKEKRVAIIIPSDVSYNVWVKKVDSFFSPHHAPQKMLVKLIKTRILDEVRVKSGAYGAQAYLASDIIQMSSYRDPKIQETFNAFQEVLRRCSEEQITTEELEHHIVRLLSKSLKPLRPARQLLKAVSAHLFHLDNAYRERIQQELVAVTVQQIQEEAKRILNSNEEELKVTLTGKKLIEKDKNIFIPFSLN